ncbi:exosortase-associated protein EpsI, V-type [Sphingomonas nostoxanthinifaciens]|uniref:exosortase-associated protein EpsI, V-type n=1 Tax=Sphingomonas nostoxanthinifaciens TaxID=2872652 RepID=UPI001CC1C485|nr:exosortase-associated protein EpsI, V-type [Sphingomonas nostoxanthinifaciens]UAK24145.1 EpsI family protein [Sphingomonas nostoxanthinifaciens]
MSDGSSSEVGPATNFVPGRRDLLLGGLAAGTAALALAGMPRRRLMAIGPRQLDSIVPLQLGAWQFETSSGLVLPPPDQLAQILYDQQVMRTYSAASLLPMMLLMAYGSSQGGMLQVHRPEICYPASGFRLSETRVITLDLGNGHSIPARTFTATGGARTEHVLYWTRIGNMLPTSWTSQRVAVMRENLRGYVPDGLLVRISTVSENGAQAAEMLGGFARTMLDRIGPAGRRMLIGTD